MTVVYHKNLPSVKSNKLLVLYHDACYSMERFILYVWEIVQEFSEYIE